MKKSLSIICLLVASFLYGISDVSTENNNFTNDDENNLIFQDFEDTLGNNGDTDDCGAIDPSVETLPPPPSPSKPTSGKKTPKQILQEKKKKKEGLMAGYYGSWGSWNAEGMQLHTVSPLVNIIYIAFSRINTAYRTDIAFNPATSFSIQEHGLEYLTFGALLDSVNKLKRARPDVIVLLSLGGETYPVDINKEMDYIPNIVKCVKDFNLDGVDIDWEPHGSFDMLNRPEYTEYYIKLISELKKNLPEGHLISVSDSSNGALSCIGLPLDFCKDNDSPYSVQKVEALQSSNPNVYYAANMVSSGTHINIFRNSGKDIDLIFIQAYNIVNVNYPLIVDIYLSHLYYGIKYDMTVIVGFSLEPGRGVFTTEDQNGLELIGKRIHEENQKNSRADAVGVWYLNMKNSLPNAHDVDKFFNTMWDHINKGLPKPRQSSK